MLNLQQLIDRYTPVINAIKSYNSSVTGFLAWGGKSWYLINSDEPLNLNGVDSPETKASDGFIVNDKGFVQEYELDPTAPIYFWFKDEACTIPVGEDEEITDDHFHVYNDNMSIKTYRAPLSSYYPHPWYPDRKIVAFKVIRIIPHWILGKEYEVDDDGLIMGEDPEASYWEGECLDFPEFFEPIYEEI